MTAEQSLLIRAIKASVCGVPVAQEAEPDWNEFVKLARSHGLGAMAYDGLQKSNYPLSEKAGQVLHSYYMQAIFRDVQQDHLKKQLQATLVETDIKHIFLKGSVLKADYPVPALRTMSDMDILVYAADFGKIDSIAKELGGKAAPGDGNHRNYAFPGGVAVEFHPNLLHHATPVGTDINPG